MISSPSNRPIVSLGLRGHYHAQEQKIDLEVLDQTALPHAESWRKCNQPDDMIHAIQTLQVRGAPLIGVAAILSLAQYALQRHTAKSFNWNDFRNQALRMREARPTAVNLMALVDRLLDLERTSFPTVEAIVQATLNSFDEDVQLCQSIAKQGLELINDGDGILTHCNTGGLATAGIGTALGIIRLAHERGKKIHVWVDETRPLLQGARLTAWELKQLGIPHTLITDSMAAHVMSLGKIQKIFVGADRIAKNGDTANKIGTLSVAIAAHFYKIPFYVAAPSTTFDPLCASEKQIPIEQRSAEEVRSGRSPATTPVYNPAFDITPGTLITGHIFEEGLRKLS